MPQLSLAKFISKAKIQLPLNILITYQYLGGESAFGHKSWP